MKRYNAMLLLLVLWISAFQAVCQESVDSSRVVRVLSFNIFHGETMKGDFDLEQIALVIRQAEPDLVAMQEVDLYTGRTNERDLASELGLLTRMVPLFGMAMPFDAVPLFLPEFQEPCPTQWGRQGTALGSRGTRGPGERGHNRLYWHPFRSYGRCGPDQASCQGQGDHGGH